MPMTTPRAFPMRILHLALTLAVAGSFAATSTLAAQTTPTATPAVGNVLTLTDALTLARRNNPTFQNASNARRTASAALRAANGAFLPNANTSFTTGFREGRQTFFQGQSFGAANDQLSTDVGANASLNLSLATLNDRRGARANLEATEADISAAEQRVRTAGRWPHRTTDPGRTSGVPRESRS